MANELKDYVVIGPDGGEYTVTAAADATDDELISFVQSQASTQTPVESQPQPSAPVVDPAGVRGVQPPKELPRQQIETIAVQGEVSEQDKEDPRFLRPEQEAVLSQAWGNPDISDEEYAEMARTFSQEHGRSYTGPTQFGQERAQYQKYLAEGGEPLGVQYSNWEPTDVVGEYIQQYDPDVGGIGAALEEGMAYNPMGIGSRLIQDWFDMEQQGGYGKDVLRQRYPDLNDDQIEEMHDGLIGEFRRRELANAGHQVEERDVSLPVRIAGNIIGGSSPVDLIPLTRGAGLPSRLAQGAVVNMAADAALQGGDLAYGAQDEYNPGQTFQAGLEGAALQGVLEGAAKGIGALANTVSRRNAVPVVDAAPISIPTSRKNSKAYRAEIAETANAIVDNINRTTEGWTNAPDFEVHESFRDIDGVDNDAIGVMTGDGKVLINATNVIAEAKARGTTPETIVNAVTFHEALGHYGLAQKFGNELETVLDIFYNNSSSTFRDKVDRWLADNPNEYKNSPNRVNRAAEEVLAEMSEQGRIPVTFLNKLTSRIKNFGRDMGLTIKFSKPEIETILGMAHNAVISGRGRDVRGNGFRYMNAVPNKELVERYMREDGMDRMQAVNRARAEVFKGSSRSGMGKRDTSELDSYIERRMEERRSQQREGSDRRGNGNRYMKTSGDEPTDINEFKERRTREQILQQSQESFEMARYVHDLVKKGDRRIRPQEIQLILNDLDKIHPIVGGEEYKLAQNTRRLLTDALDIINERGRGTANDNNKYMKRSDNDNTNSSPAKKARKYREDAIMSRQQELKNRQKGNIERAELWARQAEKEEELSATFAKYSLSRDTTRYMKRTTADELLEAQNALDILRHITADYKPVTMSMDDLRAEAAARGHDVNKLLRNKELELGDLPRRFLMQDIAAEQLNEKVSALYNKIQNGEGTKKDRLAHAQALLKYKELTARIFNEQGEAGRLLRTIQELSYTKKKITNIKDALEGFTSEDLQQLIDDPDEYLRFAKSIQDQADEAASEAKISKISDRVANTLNIPRAIMSSLDVSAPFRQGLFLVGRSEFWKSLPSMFKYLVSEDAYDSLMLDITKHDNYPYMVEGGVAFSSRTGKMSAREESFQSEYATRIPILGRGIKATERAYNGFLNKLRADTFNSIFTAAQESGVDVYQRKFLKSLGSFVSHATGRGNLGGVLNSAAPLLNSFFFSPRLMASRVQLLNPQYYITLDPFVRREAIKSLLTATGFVSTVLGLGALAGAEVELDPRSSDFGKMKTGNTRYDIPGGFAQYITLGARLVAGNQKTAMGEISEYGTDFGQKTRLDAVAKFLSNKAAPIPSFVMDALRGEDAVGEPFNMSSAVASRFMPMFAQDVVEVMQEYGPVEGSLRAAPSVLGVGIQNYIPAAADPDREVLPPNSFEMQELEDGENELISVSDGVVTLKGEAQEEWKRILNVYVREWMKDEMADPNWDKLTLEEKAEIIKEVRNDARRQTKQDMIPLLGLDNEEGS
jgi:hypothetical protein